MSPVASVLAMVGKRAAVPDSGDIFAAAGDGCSGLVGIAFVDPPDPSVIPEPCVATDVRLPEAFHRPEPSAPGG